MRLVVSGTERHKQDSQNRGDYDPEVECTASATRYIVSDKEKYRKVERS